MTFKNREEQDTGAPLPRLSLPVIVEGRYDKAAILSMFSGTVITTEGFGIFNSQEKQALIKRISENGMIVLTDSDAGGKQIRKFLSGIIPKDKIYQLYIPKIEGKERRKSHGGKEGILGVEGVGGDILRHLLLPFTKGTENIDRSSISKTELFELGLNGRDCSSYLRDRLCEKMGLPGGMNAKALLEALNIISDLNEVKNILQNL